jgi:uncharacterized protein YjlB
MSVRMALLEDVKKVAEKVTGWARPARRDLGKLKLIRPGKAHAFRFNDDGLIPNNPKWPFLLYRNAVRLPRAFDPAAVLEELFERNGWADSWRNGVYDYVHYHSRIHEVLGVARGTASVRFGGAKGRKLRLKAGDVVILPAGTGHECLSASRDFLVVGAYPKSGTYDECRASVQQCKRARKPIPKVGRPCRDPVHGAEGPLIEMWGKAP